MLAKNKANILEAALLLKDIYALYGIMDSIDAPVTLIHVQIE